MILPRANNGMQLVYSIAFFLSHCSINIILMHAKTLKDYFLQLAKITDFMIARRISQEDSNYRNEIFRTNSACISLGGKPIKVRVK